MPKNCACIIRDLRQSLYRQKNLCAMKRKSTLLIRFAVRGLMMLGFAFAMFTEVQAQALQVNLPGNYFLCSGGSVPLSPQVSGGAGSYTYTWAPATGLSCTTCPNPIASPQQTTDYTLTVRDLENTEASAMTTVLVSPTATLQVAPAATSVCAGAFVVLTATPSGGSGTCTYRWQIATGPNGPWLDMSSNWNGPELYPATLGWTIGTTHYYRAIYTCSGSLCATATSDPVSVSVAAIPAVSISPATNFVCQNEPLTLQATVSGGTGNCDIQWLSGPTTSGPWTPVPGAIGVTYLPPTDLPGTMYYTASYGCNGTNCGSTTAGQPAKVVTLTPASIIVSANDSIVCVGGTPLLTAQLQNGSPECPLQWQRSKFANGPWINISQANQLTYQVPAGNPDTSFYRVVYACFSNPPSTSGFRLSIDNAAGVVQGQQVCLNITTQNFNNIIGMQFSMQYNPAMLQLTSVSNFGLPGLSAGGSFGLPLAGGAGITAPGTITLTWTDTDWSGETLPNGTTLFTLCFNALANTSAASVAFTLTPTTIEVINTGLQDVPFNSIPGTVYFGSSCYGSISVPVSVTVRPDPAIGLLPESQTVCINSPITLTTQVSGGAGDCSFRWFSAPAPTGPWTLIPDAVGDTYQPPTQQLGLTYYMALLTCTGSGCGQPASNPAAVLVTDNLFGDEIRATPLACNVWRLSPVLPPDYFGPINALWTLPDGSTSTELQIIATQTGVYQLQISVPASPCQSYLARYINSNADECASIVGYVRHDLDEDCLPQTDEPGLANWMVRAVGPGEAFHAVTNDDGRYQFSLPLGQYDISLLPPSASWLLCADSYPVSLDQSGQVSQLDIPVKRIRPCPQLEAQLSTLLLRRCFSSTYVVKICNVGTEIAEAPVVTLVLDDFLSYQSAQRTPSSIQGQTITWELPALAPGQCRQFNVYVLVSCNAVLGQSHCSTLFVIPDPLCVHTSPAWSGASLQVSGECTGSQARFRVRNAGTGDLDAPVPCIVIEDVVMLMHQPNTINHLSIGEEVVYDFPANGSTYFFSVGQAPHHPFGNPVTLALEGCGTNNAGTFSTGFVNQFPLQNTTTASHTLCLPNIGAYDPNDKQAVPVGYGPEHFIRAGDPLHYQIRFQNTGTDTAFTVIIRDTLSPWLDMATLRPGPSSHDYKAHIDGERTLVFTFDNILLPDSTTNLDGSQGFVDFFIHTLDSIPLETRIENSAAIYFDFNEPVITNTVFHTIGRDFVRSATAVFQPDAPAAEWLLMPNPAREEAWVVLKREVSGLKTAWLYDAFGRQVLRLPFEGDRCRLPLTDLTPGWYALQLTDAAGRNLGAGRLVVR